MKKYIGGYLLLIGTLCVVFTIISFVNFRDAQKSNQNHESKDEVKNQELLPVGKAQQEILKPGAYCVMILYNRGNNERQEIQGKIQSCFVAWNRQEIISYLDSYMDYMPAKEQKKGLISYELLSFSENGMVVKKTYSPQPEDTSYYIGVQNHEVVIYYGAEKMLYEKTGIDSRMLSVEEQKKLSCGIRVKTQEELYGILEDYSS